MASYSDLVFILDRVSSPKRRSIDRKVKNWTHRSDRIIVEFRSSRPTIENRRLYRPTMNIRRVWQPIADG